MNDFDPPVDPAPSILDPANPRDVAAQLLLDAAQEFCGLQDDDRRVDDRYFEEQARVQVDALIHAGWTPPVAGDWDRITVVAELLRPFALRLGPNTVGAIQEGKREVHLTASERSQMAEAALAVAVKTLPSDVVEVLRYVSTGRRYVDVEPYPDALARRALGAMTEETGR